MKIETAKDPNGYWFVLVDNLQDCDIAYSNTEAECYKLAKRAYPRESVITTKNPKHYSNAKTITLRRMQREVGTGKPGYRWAPGYVVVNPTTGAEEYPPVGFNDARRRVRELGGTSHRII